MITKDEFKILIKALKAAFTDPRFLPDTAAYDIWYEMLKQFDYTTLSQAVYAYLQTESRQPTIADIRNKALALLGKASLSGADAWSLVYKALTNSSYNSIEEFNKLPYPVQKAVGSADMLASWATVNIEEVQTVIQSQFLKSYAVEKERFEAIRTAPDKYEQLIDSRKPVEVPVIEDKKTIKIAEDDLGVIAHKILEKLKEDAKNE